MDLVSKPVLGLHPVPAQEAKDPVTLTLTKDAVDFLQTLGLEVMSTLGADRYVISLSDGVTCEWCFDGSVNISGLRRRETEMDEDGVDQIRWNAILVKVSNGKAIVIL